MNVDQPFGRRLPDVRVRPPGPASRALARRLRQVESRNVTWVSADWPVFWEEAAGANVRDADDNLYLDLTAAFGVALLGHRSPLAAAAIERQLGRLVHGMGDVHPPTVKLEAMERLCALMPWSESRAVLSSSGSEAVETALKTAELATGRPGVVAFEGGYHGLTLGSLSVTERPHFRASFARRTYDGVAFAPFPDASADGPQASENVLETVRSALRRGAPNGDAVGAIVVEPVQARGGARIPPSGFMQELSDMAREAGALVIADEIMTGLGRCGATLASERVGLKPDIVCVGKSLGGGLPLSACVARADVMDAWPESEGEAIHTSTFLGHPLACAVAVDVLDGVASGRTSARAESEGRALLEALHAGLDGVAGVAEVRGMGMLLGIDFGSTGAGVEIARLALGHGLLTLPAGDRGEVLELTPPLGMTDEQMAYATETLTTVILKGRRPR